MRRRPAQAKRGRDPAGRSRHHPPERRTAPRSRHRVRPRRPPTLRPRPSLPAAGQLRAHALRRGPVRGRTRWLRAPGSADPRRGAHVRRWRARLAPTWTKAQVPVYSIVLAFGVAAIVVIVSSAFTATGFDPLLPFAAYARLLAGSFGSDNAIYNTLVAAAPLM